MSDDDLVGDSDDESDHEHGLSNTMTGAERTERMAKLVPGLDPAEWGSKTQQAREPSVNTKPAEDDVQDIIRDDATSKTRVSFAPGTKDPSSPHRTGAPTPQSSHPSSRPPIFEPEEYDGHIVDSEDEDDMMDAYDPAAEAVRFGGADYIPKPGFGKSRSKKKRDIDPDTLMLQDSLRTGKPIPSDRLREFKLGNSVDLSDEEDDEDDPMAGGDGVDMEDEQDEFLQFAREALGINDQVWNHMLDERKARGGRSPFDSPSASSCTLLQ